MQDNTRLAPYATLIVEGPAEEHIVSSQLPQYRPSTGGPIASLAGSTSSYTNTALTSGPPFRSVQYHKKGNKSVSIKITKATMSKMANGCRKREFNAIGQTYIDLVDATANVEFVTGTIQKRWGSDFVLVTNDGL